MKLLDEIDEKRNTDVSTWKDDTGLCGANGPVAKFKTDCPAADFDSFGMNNNGDPMTHAGTSDMYTCDCDLRPMMDSSLTTTCAHITTFMDGDCTAEGIKKMGMFECTCDCDVCDCDNCPAESREDYTKEKLATQLKMMHGLATADQNTGAVTDSCA
jgi:SUMO ligase MMS21 Smc5/6 complex component